MISVAVMGYGTVGSGVVEIIDKNQKEVNEKAGDEVSVKYILDLRDFPGDPHQEKFIKDYKILVEDPEVDIVVEASDRNNLLMDIMAVFSNAKVGVNNLHARKNAQNLSATISATIMVSDAKRLHDICVLLRGITGVYRVARVIH